MHTGIQKLQGLAHAVARGLVSLKQQRIHDAVAAGAEGMCGKVRVGWWADAAERALGCCCGVEILSGDRSTSGLVGLAGWPAPWENAVTTRRTRL